MDNQNIGLLLPTLLISLLFAGCSLSSDTDSSVLSLEAGPEEEGDRDTERRPRRTRGVSTDQGEGNSFGGQDEASSPNSQSPLLPADSEDPLQEEYETSNEGGEEQTSASCVASHCTIYEPGASSVALCQQGAPCTTDSECPSSWSTIGQCTEGVCTQLQLECESAADCFAACEAAASVVEPGAFLDCSAQKWDCSPFSDCPNAPKFCTPYSTCSSDADCFSDWFREITCEAGWCTPKRRTCNSSSACYDACRETYSAVYANDTGFSYCEDQVWLCEPEGACPELPNRCIGYPSCDSNQDCAGTWTTDSTCEDGMCIWSVVECEDPTMCTERCLEYYESLDVPGQTCTQNPWQCAPF